MQIVILHHPDDTDIEVTSTIDEEEYELVQISKNLCLDSDSTTDDDINIQDNPTIQSFSNAPTSENEKNDVNLTFSNSCFTTCSSRTESNTTPSQKRKRLTWSITEKLLAIENYEKYNSKHLTVKTIGCSRYQLSEWLKMKEELKNLQSSNKGKLLVYYVNTSCVVYFILDGQRKRLKGAGKKIKYPELDKHLRNWFNERQTPPSLEATTSIIRRERISFKQLVRRGEHLSKELKHEAPSTKWYRRFMLRHRLSLQRPKRNQKIPLSEAHKHATLFYNYLRRSATVALKEDL